MRLTKIGSAIFSLLLLAWLCAPRADAQEMQATANDQECATLQTVLNITQWVNCRVDAVVAARINQRGTHKQVESPSIADNTTSLVDRTEAPDLFGLALNFAGVNKSDDDSGNSATTITTSAYAIYAALKKEKPLDPAFYLRHKDLRRLSFTIGQDTATEGEEDGTGKATVFGFKYLIVDKRNASSKTNRTELRKVSDKLRAAAPIQAQIQSEVEDFIYDRLKSQLGYPQTGETEVDAKIRFINTQLSAAAATRATLQQLTLEDMEDIRELISNKIETIVQLRDTTTEVFETIRHRPQLSFSFQTKQRRRDGTDEYRSGLLYDFGLYQRLNVALNGTFDYEDSKTIGGDKRGGRLAAEGYFNLNREDNIFSGKDPIVLSFGAESKWMTGAKPTYTGQVKLTFPLFDGVSLPISFSVANRTDLINESDVRGRFGFTFDLAKALKGFRK